MCRFFSIGSVRDSMSNVLTITFINPQRHEGYCFVCHGHKLNSETAQLKPGNRCRYIDILSIHRHIIGFTIQKSLSKVHTTGGHYPSTHLLFSHLPSCKDHEATPSLAACYLALCGVAIYIALAR